MNSKKVTHLCYFLNHIFFNLILKGILQIQTHVTSLERRFEVANADATKVGTERHTEIIDRMGRIQVVEQALEQIRRQPAPNQHFPNDWPEILLRELNVDVNRINFKDKDGDCMLGRPSRFSLQNTNLFGTANIDRMYTRLEQGGMCGPYTIRGNILPPMPEDDVIKLQGDFLLFLFFFYLNTGTEGQNT